MTTMDETQMSQGEQLAFNTAMNDLLALASTGISPADLQKKMYEIYSKFVVYSHGSADPNPNPGEADQP